METIGIDDVTGSYLCKSTAPEVSLADTPHDEATLYGVLTESAQCFQPKLNCNL